MSHSTLPHSPLILAAATIRFSPIENIERCADLLFERLRPLGYSYCDNQPLQQFAVSGTNLKFSALDQWHIIDKKKRKSLVLSLNSITFNNADYIHFSEFQTTANQLFEIGASVLGLMSTALELVGLRFINLIRPIGGVQPEELVNQKYWGGPLNNIRMRQVMLEKNTSVNGIARIILFKPLETQSVLGSFRASLLNMTLCSADIPIVVLDMDHFKEMQSVDFDLDVIQTTINELHGELEHLFFEEIPTEQALCLWKGEQKT
jgi:uncharacterized protein (TIGR04255 family)